VKSILKKLPQLIRPLGLVMVGAVIAFVVFYMYDTLNPKQPLITEEAFNQAVARAMSSATPRPAFTTEVYEIIRPSLVRIEVESQKSGEKPSIGTGVIFDDAGHILTNLHVVEEGAKIQITFFDGSESEAEIIGALPEKDIALLNPEIVPDTLIPAVLAGSGGLRVGDEAIAVGHPFGITNTLTSGVISGLRRSFRSPSTGVEMTDLIQFDAAVNPGNSGGPLLNRRGEVVGIVTALLNPSDANFFIGIGFAVPIDTAAGAAGSPID
jgi:S1-C subfamily serine protease